MDSVDLDRACVNLFTGQRMKDLEDIGVILGNTKKRSQCGPYMSYLLFPLSKSRYDMLLSARISHVRGRAGRRERFAHWAGEGRGSIEWNAVEVG